MGPGNDQPDVTAIDLDALESKVRAWKAWEREQGMPMPFSPAQRHAISILLPPDPEPNLDDRNYIGELNEWIQKKYGAIVCKPDEEVLVEPFSKQSRFRVWYKLPGVEGQFPRERFGYAPGEEAPKFSQKKKAKLFAAKQALAWLNRAPTSDYPPGNHDDASGNGGEVGNNDGDGGDSSSDSGKGKGKVDHPRPTTQNSPESKKMKIEDAEVQDGAPIGPRPLFSEASVKSLANDNINEDEEESASIFKRIETKCKMMGIDAPQYITTCEPDGWCCLPCFWADGLMPEAMGLVRNAPNKPQAKIKAAERVLVWLSTEEQRRNKDIDTMLGNMVHKLQT
ncbi:hypothetical protein BGZ61DRAFT_438944 [Ilyonectria robusta]|uniref:uncharacterized protein n=1 Tax=Ilyonectria robusta TaxID=1079257 RepID=UPI001E8E8B9B|nr:uncharacterized protein BGZ61DRAFT_438944 [Ilyonectria robusta]KAH8737757.1 hypothetical protein BGZ61DRAFT_438944 [Ilyonectria robusta]